MSIRFLIFLLILFAIDFYVFQGVKVLMQGRTMTAQKTIYSIYWTVVFLCFAIMFSAYFFDFHSWPKAISRYAFALIAIVYLSKLFVVLFLLVDDVVRLVRWTAKMFSQWISPSSIGMQAPKTISRVDFIVRLGFIIGSIPFFSMLYGMLGNAFNYKIRKVNLLFPNLPPAFDGLKAVQISDIHIGSFIRKEHLAKAIDLVLEQRPDVIFFTGDLVNDLYTETLEFTDLLKRIQAPMGVYSIFGNHDYGDYYRWNSMEEKLNNLRSLAEFQRQLGWKLLLNEHAYLQKGEERIGIIGVENWSAKMNFRRYGDMAKATEGMNPAPFNILLSHDPSHWQAEIIPRYSNIDLMLAGHTHGMQFGVEIPGFRWSPVEYVYKEWADLYREGSQYLYVNRGLGFIGYPGRVGIMPEITVIDLHRG